MGKREVLDKLKSECESYADITGVISRFVPMNPNGREFKALCPFHDDHKPSMCVVPHKQIFHCFSCGAGGDVFTFMQKYEGLDFPDAIRRVAEILGITTDGESIKKGKTEVRERQQQAPKQMEMMSAREILEAWRWYQDHAYPPKDWADRLGVDPVAMDVTRMVAAPYLPNQGKRVLVAPMRDAEGVLCSLRFRDFETKKRWSIDKKERHGSKWVQVARTAAGVMACEETFDPDIYLGGGMDLIIEGETDLLGAITILLKDYGTDPVDWPVRIIALPGVLSCHDLLLSMKLSPMVVTFFDLDGAGFRSAFDHKPMKMVVNEDGSKSYELNHDAPVQPGLIRKLAQNGVQSRACFPPVSDNGEKYDLRDMAQDGWTWQRLHEHLLAQCTADPNGRRIKRKVK